MSGQPVFVYILATCATLGGLLLGYHTGIVSGAMLLIQPFFDLDSLWHEFIVSGTIGAAAIASLCSGHVGDLLGRKKTIVISSVIFVIGSVVMAAAPSKEILLTGRVVVGIGIGITSMMVPVYIAETSPPVIRGRLVTLNQLFICVGILTSSIIAGLFSDNKTTGWRYMLGLGAGPALIQFVGFIFLPESPRWLMVKERHEEARAVLERISRPEDVDDLFTAITESVTSDKERSVQRNAVIRIFTTPYVMRALFIGSALCIFSQLSGINALIYYTGTILKMVGFPVKHAIWLVSVPNAVLFVATFFGLWTVERFGRKASLCFSTAGVILSLIVVAVGFQLSMTYSPAINATVVEFYDNGTLITRCHTQYDSCDACIKDKGCGFCYDDLAHATCLPAKDELTSSTGRCNSSDESAQFTWSRGYCPNQFTWIPVLGMTLFVLAFAPGLGPMPWTINAEIYPLWARGICMSIATASLWVFNLVLSMTFLTLTETITAYGTFYMFAGMSTLGLLFLIVLLPETKNKTLEEVEELFMTKDEMRIRHETESVPISNGAQSDTKM